MAGGPFKADTNPTPQDIWDELRHYGASPVQAAAIMGNGIAESGLNPEARVIDSNGAYSNGIWQFNEASYPGAGNLVTGQPAKDLTAQVKFLIANGGLRAARGSNPAEAASNFASGFERCSTCQSGGASNKERQANATQVAGWASSNDWPASTGQAADTASLTSSQATQESQSCAWFLGGGEINLLIYHQSLPGFCVISRPQLRALLGAGLLVGAGVLGLAGLVILIAASGAPARIASAAKAVPGVGGIAAAVAPSPPPRPAYTRSGKQIAQTGP